MSKEYGLIFRAHWQTPCQTRTGIREGNMRVKEKGDGGSGSYDLRDLEEKIMRAADGCLRLGGNLVDRTDQNVIHGDIE